MSVRKAKNGFFYFSVRLPDKNGVLRQKKVQNSNWKTKKEALEAERVFLNLNSQVIRKMKYKDLFDLFIHNRETKLKERSIQTYKDVHRFHILPEFGNLLITNITKEQIRRWQKELVKKEYSDNYMKTIQTNFRRVLIWGVNNDYIDLNPFKIEYTHKNPAKPEMKYFTLDEYRQFKSVIDDPMYAIIFDVLYWCGLRKGELQALKFTDIDFRENVIHIDKTYDYRNHIITTPKCRTSYRDVMMTTDLRKSLFDYIENCKRLAGFKPDFYLFGIDTPIAPTTLDRKKSQYCRLAGVKQIRIHDFRHSHVSLLINHGINDFDISKRLGHSRDMVNNTYGHWFKKSQENLVSKLDRISEIKPNSRSLKN